MQGISSMKCSIGIKMEAPFLNIKNGGTIFYFFFFRLLDYQYFGLVFSLEEWCADM